MPTITTRQFYLDQAPSPFPFPNLLDTTESDIAGIIAACIDKPAQRHIFGQAYAPSATLQLIDGDAGTTCRFLFIAELPEQSDYVIITAIDTIGTNPNPS